MNRSLSNLRRRVYRVCFSVRGMTIGVLILGGFIGPMILRARSQRAAVQAILSLGGRIAYDWQCFEREDGTWEEHDGEPGWLARSTIRMFGPDAFGRVAKVHLKATLTNRIAPEFKPQVEATLAALETLRDLRSLDLEESDIDTASLRHVKALRHLTHLGIQVDFHPSGRVEAAGLQYLKDLRELRDLDLSGVEFRDQDLSPLYHVGTVRRLTLFGHSITDDGMKIVAKLPGLRSLKLSEVLVTNEGIGYLHDSHITELDVDVRRFTPFAFFVLKCAFAKYHEFRNPLEVARGQFFQFLFDLCRYGTTDIQAHGYVYESAINDETYDQLATIDSLEILEIDDSDMNEDRVERLLKSRHLTRINVEHPRSFFLGEGISPPSWFKLLPPELRVANRNRSIPFGGCGNAWRVRTGLLTKKYVDRQAKRLAALSTGPKEESKPQQ